MDEVFELVQREITDAGYARRLSAGIVLTGGGAGMRGMRDLATDVFGIGVRVGSPADNTSGLSDAVEAPRFATAVGLAEYGAQRVALGGAASGVRRTPASSPGVARWIERVRVWLQDFF